MLARNLPSARCTPEVVAGNTNAPTMMVADVAADRIVGSVLADGDLP